MKPIIADIQSFELIDANGTRKTCSRTENSDLFSLVIGGYGLFGIVYSICLRLTPREKMERIVEIITADELHSAFERRIRDGFLYGDFQYAIDERSDDFLWKGVLSCYRPVDRGTKAPGKQKEISLRIWHELVYMAHVEKSRAFKLYADYYMSTTGQVYWSDTLQLGGYLDDYHHKLDRRMRAPSKATEIITEIFVPRERLADFLTEAREDFRQNAVNVIYGTIRLIEQDDESFLAWAKQPYACVIFNLHTEHTPRGIEHSADAFRRLIDMASRRGGSYFLTYHRFAGREQLQACYPQFREFLQLKQEHDPKELFQSDWYVDYKQQFAG
jgi:FAD/FMN-containing dehydrogenase